MLLSTRDAWWVTCIYLTYFFMPRNIRQGFQAFECQPVCGHVYLSAALQEQCWVDGGRHMWWVVCVATPTLLLNTLLVPAAALLYLRHFRRKGLLGTDHRVVFRLGFVFSGYADEFWWYESVILVRKVAIILFVTFAGRSEYQLQLCMAVLVVMLYLHERFRPFHGQRAGDIAEQERQFWIRKRLEALASQHALLRVHAGSSISSISSKNSSSKSNSASIGSDSGGRSTSAFRISRQQRAATEHAERVKEGAVADSLHNAEVLSLMVLIFMVWIATYFRVEGSCLGEDPTSVLDEVAVCEALGFVSVAVNVVFVLLSGSVFFKSLVQRNMKHVGSVRRMCRTVYENVCKPRGGLHVDRRDGGACAIVVEEEHATGHATQIGIQMTPINPVLVESGGGAAPACAVSLISELPNTQPDNFITTEEKSNDNSNSSSTDISNDICTPSSASRHRRATTAPALTLAEEQGSRRRRPRRAHTRHVTDEGDEYFVDVESQTSVWELPEDGQVVETDGEGAGSARQRRLMKLKMKTNSASTRSDLP